MPAAVPDIGVLRRHDVPAAVDLAPHASADALAVLLAQCIVHHLALDPEPRSQDCDVGGDERHFDLGRASRAGPIRAVRAVHQVAEALATRGPGAVDGDDVRRRRATRRWHRLNQRTIYRAGSRAFSSPVDDAIQG
jgi:hypothetical protein